MVSLYKQIQHQLHNLKKFKLKHYPMNRLSLFLLPCWTWMNNYKPWVFIKKLQVKSKIYWILVNWEGKVVFFPHSLDLIPLQILLLLITLKILQRKASSNVQVINYHMVIFYNLIWMLRLNQINQAKKSLTCYKIIGCSMVDYVEMLT